MSLFKTKVQWGKSEQYLPLGVGRAQEGLGR